MESVFADAVLLSRFVVEEGGGMSYANRGMDFEALIEFSNRQYETQGLAVINKRPTPVKIIQKLAGGWIKGFVEKQSTVDFDGTVRGGRSIVFEAKQVKSETRFDLRNIEQHQVDYLAKCHKMGGISFVLIEVVAMRTIFLLPYETLNYYWIRKQQGIRGTQSIPFDDLEVNAWVVRSGRVPVDYLPIVNKIWKLEAA